MARLGANFIVEIDGIATARDSLGKSVTVRYGTESWRIDLPERPDSFPYVRASLGRSAEVDPRDYAPVSLVDLGQTFVDVRMLRLVANFDSDLSAATFDAERDMPAYEETLHRYRDKALTLARDFAARLRLTTDQVTIAPAGEYPKLVGAMQLSDLDAQRTFNTMLAPGGFIRVIDDGYILDSAALEDMEDEMRRGLLDPEEVLLSEARYLADTFQDGAGDRATLLAAIAVELRTKRVLRAGEPEVLELLLENPRDWSMSAHGLYLKALPRFAGRDLGEEHRASAVRLQRLFTERNRIAHKGVAVSRDDGQAHVASAMEAFHILRKVLDRHEGGEGLQQSARGQPQSS